MPNLKDQIAEAKKHNYSDDQILGYLENTNPDLAPKIKEARGHGYAAKDINDFLSQDDEPTTSPNTGSKFFDGFHSVVNTPSVLESIGAGVSPVLAFGRALAGTNAKYGTLDQQQQAEQAASFKATHDAIAGHVKKGEYGQAMGALGSDILDRMGLGVLRDKLSSGDYEGAAGVGAGIASLLGISGGASAITGKGALILHDATTPHPDLALMNAVKPHPADTGFMDSAPFVREAIKRGEKLTDTPITDVPSAIKATEAAMDEHMQALETHKAVARDKGLKMPTSVIKQAAIKALPDDLAAVHPDQYNAAVAEINAMFPNKHYLDVDEVFNQAKLNNGLTSRLHSSPEAIQNNKMVTNGGDMGSLKAMGDAYRNWIDENLGTPAANLNSSWGKLNQMKHYLQAKENPALMEEGMSPLARFADKIGISPAHAMFTSKESLITGMLKRLTGEPRTINEMLTSSFNNSEPGMPPVEINQRQPIMRDDRLLKPASSSVGVSGVIVPDVMGEAIKAGKKVSGGPRQIEAPPKPAVPTSGKTIVVAPKDVEDASGIKTSDYVANPEIAARDHTSLRLYNKAYSRLNAQQRHVIDNYASGKPLKLQDFLSNIP